MSKVKVLTVDDDRGITSIVRKILERSGNYEVREENLSEHALTAAIEYGPDVILLDWNMPILNGEEVAAQLAGETQTAGIPIIFVTGFADTAQKLRRPTLQKPISMTSLCDAITKVLTV